MTRPRNWKEARSLHCRALITHHSDRDAPPLYLAVSISHLAVNSAVKHQLSALYCVQAHLTIKLPLRLPFKMPQVVRQPWAKLSTVVLRIHLPAG